MTNSSKGMDVYDILDKSVASLQSLFIFVKNAVVKHYILSLSLIIFIIIMPIVHHIHVFETMGIVRNFPITTIVFTVVIFFTSLSIIILKTNNEDRNINLENIPKALYSASYLFSIFIVYSLLFHISKYFIYNSTSTSISITGLMLLLFLSLKLSYDREGNNSDDFNDKKETFFRIVKNIIFVIPCLLVDTIEWSKQHLSGLPKTSNIVMIFIFISISIFYFFPILKSLIEIKKGITLIKSAKSLDDIVIYLSQNELKDKIIESKPFLKRKMLETNNYFKTHLENDSKTESFDPNIHLLDKNINFHDEIKKLNDDEKDVLADKMNITISIDDFKNVQQFKDYILSLQDTDNYYGLLQKINEYNTKKNDFIHQEASHLVHMINRSNHIHDYNYHYGISFWIYFDPTLKNKKTEDTNGLIMTYSDSPKIFYDYETNEIKMSIKECNNQKIMNGDNELFCSKNIIYKSDNILFQRWNHFVVNYNYGTLDCFINNNLVVTKDKVAPYIEEAFLQFGSKMEPTHNCGICNIVYYDRPLNLYDINEIYKTKNIPCS